MKRLAATLFFLLLFAATLDGSLQAQTDRYFYFNGGARTVLPGEPIRYAYEIWAAENSQSPKATFHLYRVPFAVRLTWMLHGTRALHAKDVAKLVLLQTLERSGARSDRHNAYEFNIDFGRLDVGEYLVTTESSQGYSAEAIDVGSLGSVWHVGADSLLVYAVDLRSMRHRSDVQYRLERTDGSHSGLVVFGGLSWLHGSEKRGGVLVGRASDGSMTMQQLGEGGSGQQSGYVQTDRPIYRPGQHIYVRSILRTGFIGAYSIPHGKVRIVVHAPDGSTVYDRSSSLTPFGTVWADVQLPDSAPLGEYQIVAGNASASVSVQAYKKPEYLLHASTPKDYLVSGQSATFTIDAKYFFGRPAADMNIHYRAYREPYFWGWYNPYSFMSERPYREAIELSAGDVKTDADGRVTIAVPTKHEDTDDTLRLQVDGRDASGRTVSTQTSITLVPAQFRIELQPDKWFAQLGDTVAVAVATKDYEGHARPGATLDVEVTGERWDYRTHTEHKLPAHSETVTTDAAGRAIFRWRPEHAGSYQINVSGKDPEDHVARASLWFWVSSSNEAWWYPNQQITLLADKETYQPGQSAHILLTTPQADADALLMVSSDRIVSARLIHVSSKPQTLVVSPPKDASVYRVTLEMPSNQGLQTGETSIKISPAPRALRVTIAPNKKRYEPGATATFSVHVRDVDGKPVHAELGLGVVDESLFAVKEDRASSAQEQLYDSRLAWIQSGASWYSVQKLVKSGVTADNYSVTTRAAANAARLGGGGPLSPAYSAIVSTPEKPRSYFPDTAYWKPDIVTDERGNATISFAWPDSLTTWRATGVAVDANTSVGAGKEDSLVTKDFLVRLEMPRFLRRGDQSTLLGLVNGRPGSTNASLTLDAGDLLRTGSPDARFALDRYASGSAQWSVNPLTSLGVRQITLNGTDGVLSDAMRLPLPIEAAGAAEHVRDAGEVHERNALAFTLPAMYDPGELRITMAPSVVASLIQNVQLLDIYPYYCTEQTMSAALPAVFVDRLLKRTSLPQPQDAPATGTIVNKGIARLRELQHDDGSWGWWESDDGHPFMTAYALYGLAEFKKAGYAVPEAMIDRGVESLKSQMKSENRDTLRYWGGRQNHSEWNTRAFMLYALADVAPRQVDATLLAQTMQHASDLNAYALAVLGLAQHELGNDSAAREVLAALNARATTDGAYTFWLGQTWEYGWEDDPIETTAYALRLNTTLEPQSPRVGSIVNFLRAQQHGSWWYTTKDTAAAVYALSETVPASSPEFHPNEDLKIFADDKLIDRLHIDRAVLTSKDGTITVPSADFEHGGTLRFELTGTGSLYWATDWVRYAPPYARQVADASQSLLSRLRAKPSAFSIARKYTAKRWPWQIGDEVTVDVTVSVAADTQYVAVEDPFPAGVEYQPLQGEAGNSWSGVQFFDDRAVFFADRLSSNYPLHLQYALRVTTAGTYTAAPPTAYAMYGPPVSAVGQPDKVTIRQ